MSPADGALPSDEARRAPELQPILAHLNAGPSRTWSVIVTVFGDSLVPRGGTVWLGTLLTIFRALDIGGGVVRTAMSRLTADDWLERTKVGRNSYYRLAAEGHAAFARASEQIYTRRPPPWSGHFDMLLVDPVGDPAMAKRAVDAGFGSPGADVWIAPGGTALAPGEGVIRVMISGEPTELRALAARAWDLRATSEAYQRFIAVFAPLGTALKSGVMLSDLDAFLARTLLIHAYRRIVLRDPLLPPEVLPPDWPGTEARTLCASVYRRTLEASERWLDDNAVGEGGERLSANPAIVGSRFRD